MPKRPSTLQRKLSRRRFMGLVTVAAGVTALPALPLAAPAEKTAPAGARGKATAGGAAETAAKSAAPAFTAAERKELVRLVAQVEDALKKIRAYPLPAGSDPATRFAVLRPSRGRR